ncbi:MAG: hypothetical protein KZQ83_07950 [gamma proteobacterium symbiont of Taylorina sp.]|nr:hypothetical protein [gamma proteobacterium symbiont of Taylorina sp.]
MNLFSFSKPKRTLINLLFILGLISIFITSLAVTSVVLWNYYPDIFAKIDKMIPNYYHKKIKFLYSVVSDSNNEEERYQYYHKLYEKLTDTSTLSKYYHFRQESAGYLINYYIDKGQLSQAMEIAEKWEKNYPYDFSAKFAYIRTLSQIDHNLSSSYYKKLYEKHRDIVEVSNGYISYLIEQKQYNRALNVARKNSKTAQQNATFQVFYNDDKEGFSESQSIKYSAGNYTIIDNVHHLNLSKKMTRFNGLRFDLDSLAIGTVISDVNTSLSPLRLKEELIISGTKHLKKIKSNKYQITGLDPYFVFELPESINHYQGKLDIKFSVKIYQGSYQLNDILSSNEWQLSTINKKKSYPFSLNNINNSYTAKRQIDSTMTSKVRIDWPSLQSLKIKNFKLVLNEQYEYDKKDIMSQNSIESLADSLMIAADNPYIVIDLKKSLDIKQFKIDIDFDNTIK